MTETFYRVLVIDDEAIVRSAIVGLLERAGYSCAEAGDACLARAFVDVERFDLVLCDVRLGRESGLELAAQIIERQPEVALLLVSALDDPQLGLEAFEMGVFGYIVKPFRSSELLLQIASALARRQQMHDQVARRQTIELLHRTKTSELVETVGKLRDAERETLRRLATVAEMRDVETGAHVSRVGALCTRLARALGLDEPTCITLAEAAPLHDIGKVAIPDAILLKPGELTSDERRRMQMHTEIGHHLLSGSDVPALQMAATLALTHHEHYDGGGYPRNLAGDEIPLIGRLTAVVDVYDALTSARPYRPALEPKEALQIVRSGRGRQFDPRILDVFTERIAPALCMTAV